MGGSVVFYRYRCKNFLTYNCNNLVYVNGVAYAICLENGHNGEVAPGTSGSPFAASTSVGDGAIFGAFGLVKSFPGGPKGKPDDGEDEFDVIEDDE